MLLAIGIFSSVGSSRFDQGLAPKDIFSSPRRSERKTQGLGVKYLATDGLINLLNDTSPRVRQIGAVELGELGFKGKDAVPKLIELLDDESHEVKIAVIDALGLIEAEDALPKLVELLFDEAYEGHALEAVDSISLDKASIPTLLRILDHEDYRIRRMSNNQLKELGEKARVKEVVVKLSELAGYNQHYKSAYEALSTIIGFDYKNKNTLREMGLNDTEIGLVERGMESGSKKSHNSGYSSLCSLFSFSDFPTEQFNEADRRDEYRNDC